MKYNIRLELGGNSINRFPTMTFRQGEKNSLEIDLFYVSEDPETRRKISKPIDITGRLVTLVVQYSDGRTYEKMLDKKDSKQGKVEYRLYDSDVSLPGYVIANLRIYTENGEFVEFDTLSFKILAKGESAR